MGVREVVGELNGTKKDLHEGKQLQESEQVQESRQVHENEPVQDSMVEQKGKPGEKVILGRVLSWVLGMINLGLLFVLAVCVVGTVKEYNDLEREERFLAEERQRFADLQEDTEELKEEFEDLQMQYDADLEEDEKDFREQYGRSSEEAFETSDSILQGLDYYEDDFQSNSLEYDVMDQEHSYWTELATDFLESSGDQQLDCINVYHGPLYEKDNSELIQTIFEEQMGDDIYSYTKDVDFDGNEDLIVNHSIYGDESVDSNSIYLWDTKHKKLVYGGCIEGSTGNLQVSEKNKVILYKNDDQYELWKFVNGELRYLGTEGDQK